LKDIQNGDELDLDSKDNEKEINKLSDSDKEELKDMMKNALLSINQENEFNEIETNIENNEQKHIVIKRTSRENFKNKNKHSDNANIVGNDDIDSQDQNENKFKSKNRSKHHTGNKNQKINSNQVFVSNPLNWDNGENSDYLDTMNIITDDYKVPYSLMEPMLRPFVEKNQRIHTDRLNSSNKINFNTKEKIRITPLGGLGEVGGNMTVIETENEAIVIDAGISFPTSDMHGVDILIPDFSYLKVIEEKLIAIIITHGHEDHIGAMPYLFKDIQVPIYGTPLPLAMILNKFQEHKMAHFKSYFRPVEKRQVIQIGNDFQVEWIHMTHSIIDSSSLAIITDAGTIIHTGDFKFDHTPVDGYASDIHRLAYYGEEGVLALLSDSTNAQNSGSSKSESIVFSTFDKIFNNTQGRIIMSTFSSNIHRVYQAIAVGMKYGRKVCIIGRSMERNLELAVNYDYIRLNKEVIIEAHELNQYRDNEVLIVTTGSQGETNSALYKIARDEHRVVKIKTTDTVILSAKAIPGNETSIFTVINYLEMLGAKVFHKTEDIHVSGHAPQEDQKLMIRLIKPRFFVPIHGEYTHINAHKQTAKSCGIPERNTILMKDGDQIEIHPKYIKRVKHIRTGKVFIDNENNIKIDNDIVLDRQKLATDGIVVIVAQVSKDDSALITKPLVTSFGLVSEKNEKYLSHEMTEVLEHFIDNLKPQFFDNPKALETELKNVVRKHLYRKYKKYPLIVPSVFIM
jgi:ribonuclease J